MSVQLSDGLYAMTIGPDLSTRVLAGPFHDIDDVLDACFDELMATERDRDAVFYAEVLGGSAVVRAFPHGAFPMEHVSGG
jgi:hypothetical protein